MFYKDGEARMTRMLVKFNSMNFWLKMMTFVACYSAYFSLVSVLLNTLYLRDLASSLAVFSFSYFVLFLFMLNMNCYRVHYFGLIYVLSFFY